MKSFTLRAPILRLSACLAVAMAIPPTLSGQGGPGCPPEEADRFDFLVGRWDGTEKRVVEGDTVIVAEATVFAERAAGGCVLQERWEVRENGAKLFDAAVLRAWDAEAERWSLAYADNAGRFQLYEGEQGPHGWAFLRERPGPEGRPVHVRIVWQPSSEGVRQIIKRSEDGKSWQMSSVIDYVPASD